MIDDQPDYDERGGIPLCGNCWMRHWPEAECDRDAYYLSQKPHEDAINRKRARADLRDELADLAYTCDGFPMEDWTATVVAAYHALEE